MSTVRDAVVDTGHTATGFLAVLGAPLFLGQTALRLRQALLVVSEVPGVADLLTGVQHDRTVQAEVNADLSITWPQRSDTLLHQNAHEVAPGGVAADGDGAGRGAIGQGARPADRQWRLHFGERECLGLGIPAEGRRGVLSRLPAVFLVEAGILGAALEEVAKGAIKMPQRLLRRHARYVIQPGRRWLAFEHSERRRGRGVADTLLALIVSVGTQAQPPVVDETRTPERPRKHGGLFGRWIAPIAIGAFLAHAHILPHSV